MSQLDLSHYGLSELPRFGKDHLALADWRLSVPHQRNQGGESLAFVEFDFQHASGAKRVSLEGGSRVGLPTDSDDLFLIGLLTLASALDFPAKFHFEPSHVLQVLRMPVRDRHIIAQRRAYERLVALTAMFRGTWFDRESKRLDGDFITGVIAEVCYQPHRGRRPKGEPPASYVQFTDNFHQSLTAGNLISIDLELLSGWSSPTAALLYRHLNKVWHSGRKPSRYERDLKEIACGHLHMTDGKNLKENFAKVIAEMEQRRFLAPMTKGDRFRMIRRGVWRVSFELHAERIVVPKRKEPALVIEAHSDAREIVRAYAVARFGSNDYRPEAHEIDHATSLISEYGREAVLRATPRVAERVKQQSKGDVYFGFAIPFYREILQRDRHQVRETAKDAERALHAQTEQTRIEELQRERREYRAQRLAVWTAADGEERRRIVSRALAKAASHAARERILRSTATDPPAEVLHEIALPVLTTSST